MADYNQLQSMNIKIDALEIFIAQLAIKFPQGLAALQAQGNLRRTFKVTGDSKIAIFAGPGVDSRKVGSMEPGACFGVVEQKMSGDGRAYLRPSAEGAEPLCNPNVMVTSDVTNFNKVSSLG